MTGASYYVEPALYDLIYGDVENDIAPHVAAMRAAGGPTLEVCCGNGRLLVPTLEAGVECDGLDVDAAMLENLRERLHERRLEATLHEADMRAFTLPRRYAAIAIRFNSYLHNLTQDDQLGTLRCCRAHLAPGGRLELNVFHPDSGKLAEGSGPEKLFKERTVGPRVVRILDRTEDDHVEQIRHVFRRIEIVERGRITEERHARFSLRYVFKPEMELLLRVAGFTRWSVRALGGSHGPSVPAAAAAKDAPPAPPREGDILTWTAWHD